MKFNCFLPLGTPAIGAVLTGLAGTAAAVDPGVGAPGVGVVDPGLDQPGMVG